MALTDKTGAPVTVTKESENFIAEALAQTKAEGKRIIPQCPTVVSYLEKHPEYDDIVDRD